MKKIKAPIDEKNVCSDWIEQIFDNSDCLWCDKQAIGYIEEEPVYAHWEDNQIHWKVVNERKAETILAILKARLMAFETDESDVYSEIYTFNTFIVQTFYFKEE